MRRAETTLTRHRPRDQAHTAAVAARGTKEPELENASASATPFRTPPYAWDGSGSHAHRRRFWAWTMHHLVYPVPPVVAVWAVVSVTMVLADPSGVWTAESVRGPVVLNVRCVHSLVRLDKLDSLELMRDRADRYVSPIELSIVRVVDAIDGLGDRGVYSSAETAVLAGGCCTSNALAWLEASD